MKTRFCDPIFCNLFVVKFSIHEDANLLNDNLVSFNYDGDEKGGVINMLFELNAIDGKIQPLDTLEYHKINMSPIEIELSIIDKFGDVLRILKFKDCEITWLGALADFDYRSKEVHQLNVGIKYENIINEKYEND